CGVPAGADEPSVGSAQITVQQDPQGVWFLARSGDQQLPLAFYQRATRDQQGKYQRAHYLHPVYDLQGRVITEDFPADHPHHRGIFWAWHQLLVGDQAAGDGWATRDFQWDVRQVHVAAAGVRPVLRSIVHWKSPAVVDSSGEPRPLVEETCYLAVTAETERRLLDFEIQLRALQDHVRLGGSEDDKGYGGFSARVLLAPETRFMSADGAVEPRLTATAASPWMDIRHPEFGLAMLAHPSLPNYPPTWILRQQKSMQNAVYPGRDPVPLPTDRPLVLRYRLVIHSGQQPTGQEGADRLRLWHAEYARQALPDWRQFDWQPLGGRH
ncbi:MAG: PmoA family protein, partial [Pirellulaceae bacterium]|nr:PmoA family protein [Pirellulaceae bacterium]